MDGGGYRDWQAKQFAQIVPIPTARNPVVEQGNDTVQEGGIIRVFAEFGEYSSPENDTGPCGPSTQSFGNESIEPPLPGFGDGDPSFNNVDRFKVDSH